MIQKLMKNKLQRLKLDSFQQTQKINNDGNVELNFKNYITKEQIAYARFKLGTGQIGILDINKKFQRRGLGKQIIQHIENEFKKTNLKEIWVACSRNHFYWSKLPGFHYKEPVHNSVTGCGYLKKINY